MQCGGGDGFLSRRNAFPDLGDSGNAPPLRDPRLGHLDGAGRAFPSLMTPGLLCLEPRAHPGSARRPALTLSAGVPIPYPTQRA